MDEHSLNHLNMGITPDANATKMYIGWLHYDSYSESDVVCVTFHPKTAMAHCATHAAKTSESLDAKWSEHQDESGNRVWASDFAGSPFTYTVQEVPTGVLLKK